MLGVTYIAATLDFLYPTIQNQHLSFLLPVIPFTLSCVFADSFIRISSMRSINDIIKFLEVTQKYGGLKDQGFLRYFWMLFLLYATTAVARFIVFSVTFHEIGAVVKALQLGPGWRRLQSLVSFSSYFMHDGSLLCALCFLVVFGQRAVSCFALLCEDIAGYCAQSVCSTSNAFQVNLGKLQPPRAPEMGEGEELIDKFSQLKVAFGIYLSVGGAFAFGLVTYIGTWAFFLACTVLFNEDPINSAFLRTVTAFQSLTTVLMLVTIAELGHQLKSQVNEARAKSCSS